MSTGIFTVFQEYTSSIFFGLVGVFLFIQTGKIRFIFDNDAMEVVVSKKESSESIESLVKTSMSVFSIH